MPTTKRRLEVPQPYVEFWTKLAGACEWLPLEYAQDGTVCESGLFDEHLECSEKRGLES